MCNDLELRFEPILVGIVRMQVRRRLASTLRGRDVRQDRFDRAAVTDHQAPFHLTDTGGIRRSHAKRAQ